MLRKMRIVAMTPENSRSTRQFHQIIKQSAINGYQPLTVLFCVFSKILIRRFQRNSRDSARKEEVCQ